MLYMAQNVKIPVALFPPLFQIGCSAFNNRLTIFERHLPKKLQFSVTIIGFDPIIIIIIIGLLLLIIGFGPHPTLCLHRAIVVQKH